MSSKTTACSNADDVRAQRIAVEIWKYFPSFAGKAEIDIDICERQFVSFTVFETRKASIYCLAIQIYISCVCAAKNIRPRFRTMELPSQDVDSPPLPGGTWTTPLPIVLMARGERRGKEIVSSFSRQIRFFSGLISNIFFFFFFFFFF